MKANLRPKRGNLATNYDCSVAIRQKTMRPQFGKKYDVKKFRNIKDASTDLFSSHRNRHRAGGDDFFRSPDGAP